MNHQKQSVLAEKTEEDHLAKRVEFVYEEEFNDIRDPDTRTERL